MAGARDDVLEWGDGSRRPRHARRGAAAVAVVVLAAVVALASRHAGGTAQPRPHPTPPPWTPPPRLSVVIRESIPGTEEIRTRAWIVNDGAAPVDVVAADIRAGGMSLSAVVASQPGDDLITRLPVHVDAGGTGVLQAILRVTDCAAAASSPLPHVLVTVREGSVLEPVDVLATGLRRWQGVLRCSLPPSVLLDYDGPPLTLVGPALTGTATHPASSPRPIPRGVTDLVGGCVGPPGSGVDVRLSNAGSMEQQHVDCGPVYSVITEDLSFGGTLTVTSRSGASYRLRLARLTAR